MVDLSRPLVDFLALGYFLFFSEADAVVVDCLSTLTEEEVTDWAEVSFSLFVNCDCM